MTTNIRREIFDRRTCELEKQNFGLSPATFFSQFIAQIPRRHRLREVDLGFDLVFDLGFELGFELGFDLEFDLGIDLGFDLGFDPKRGSHIRTTRV